MARDARKPARERIEAVHDLALTHRNFALRPLLEMVAKESDAEIKGLLAHPDVPLRPDDGGLADFLMLGARPMDRQDVTCFAGISALVPAHVAIVTPTGATTHRYWDFDTGRALRLGSFDEYAEAFREHFAEAVRRRTRSRSGVAVSVSGGLDSSSVFCQAEQLRRAGKSAHRLIAQLLWSRQI